MVRARIQKNFTLKDYAKVKAIKKQSEQKDFFVEGDIIECDEEMAKYLDGDNPLGTSFIKVIEVIADEEMIKKYVVDDKPLIVETAVELKKITKKRKKKLDK